MNWPLLVVILKGVVELSLLCFIAQGVLYAFAGAKRDGNAIYQLFAFINKPVWKAARFVAPRFIVDAHVGFVAFFFLAVIWVLLLATKVYFHLQLNAPPA